MSPQTVAFTIPGAPATITAQQKGVNFKSRAFYTKADVKREARRLRGYARPHRPSQPMSGPVYCLIRYVYPMTQNLAKKHADKLSVENFTLLHTQKPDADNSSKLLLDVLTECGFWIDDKQVCDLCLQKRYGSEPRIDVIITEFES
jgi:Holliday junction resolvase RusA-like endonuclease